MEAILLYIVLLLALARDQCFPDKKEQLSKFLLFKV